MPKRAILTTEEYLINATLPPATDTYTVISHEAIIERTKAALKQKGFEIERELYRCNDAAQVAQGVYHLKYGNDPDMSLLFAWSNSYDKSMKFKCSVGAYVHASLASIIGSNMASWGRKHTGTADEDTFGMIDSQIEFADDYFKQLVIDKEVMKTIPVTEQIRGELMGRLYFIHELLTGEQLGLARDQFNKPSFAYTGVKDSLWSMYNAIIYSLQKAHPRTWMDQQRMVHWFLCDHFKITSGVLQEDEQNRVNGEEPLANPNQLSLIDEIEQAEQVGGGEIFAKTADQTIVVERSESEVNQVAYDIVKNNVDIAIKETLIKNAEVTMLPTATESPEVMQEEIPLDQDDANWPCIKCGTMQGPTSLWNEGQLCTTCFNQE